MSWVKMNKAKRRFSIVVKAANLRREKERIGLNITKSYILSRYRRKYRSLLKPNKLR